MAGLPGPGLTVELASIAREFSLGGVVLFARNAEEPEQLDDLARQIVELDPSLPPWVAAGMERGGVPGPGRGFTEWPPLAMLGRAGDVDLARRFGTALASELRAVGITLTLAPVLDVATNRGDPEAGDRALGDRADLVATLGAAVVEAMQQSGVAACGRHFPGGGGASIESSGNLPLVEHDPDHLRQVDLRPFRAAIDAGVASIMVGHVFVPALDEEAPAPLSRSIVTGLLRDELGFDGVVFTDDLELKPLTGRIGVPEAAVRAVLAGCDSVLVCGADPDLQYATLEALIHAVEEERLPYSRVDAALTRQRRAKEDALMRRAGPVRPFRERRRIVGCEAHQLIAAEMARFR